MKIKVWHYNLYTRKREFEIVEWSVTTPGEKFWFIAPRCLVFIGGVILMYTLLCAIMLAF